MAVRKVSVSLPEDVTESALESALRRGMGLSAWLTEAAREKLQAELQLDEGYQAAQELIVEYEAKHGPISADAWTFAEEVVASALAGNERSDDVTATG